MSTRRDWLTVHELAEELGVPVNTVYQWRSRGTGPRGGRFGKHVRFRRSDVDKWIASHMDSDATN